jgi:DNA-binding MarR family transcriptional regulator
MPQKENMGKLVGITARAMSRHLIENFREAGHDIGMGHFMVLAYLWEEDGQSQNLLMEHCGLHKTGMSRTIDALEKLNFVVRVPDQLDRRHKLIYLTHEGKKIRHNMEKIGSGALQKALEGIDADELAICQKVLSQIQDNLKAYI